MAAYYVDIAAGSDANPGTSPGAGNAKQTLQAGASLITSPADILYVKASGTYTLTSTVTLPAGVKGDTTTGRIRVEGYTTTPGARDGRPLITSATNSVGLFTLNDNDFWEFVHLQLTHTAATRGAAFAGVTSASSPLWFDDLIVDGCLSFMTAQTLIMTLKGCEVKNCTATTGLIVTNGATGQVNLFGCDLHDNTGGAVIRPGTSGTSVNADGCIFSGNGIGIELTATSAASTLQLRSCDFVSQSGDGVKLANNSTVVTLELEDNVFYNNGGWGIENLATNPVLNNANVRINRNNAYGSNTSGNYTGVAAGDGEIALSADPFVNRVGRNFAPNATAGGGAALRAAGFPTAFPGGTTANFRDVGAVQHQDAGGSVSTRPSVLQPGTFFFIG